MNFAMMFGVFYFGFTAGGDSARNAQIAIGISAAFFLFGFGYIVVRSFVTGRSIFVRPHENHLQFDRETSGNV